MHREQIISKGLSTEQKRHYRFVHAEILICQHRYLYHRYNNLQQKCSANKILVFTRLDSPA